MRTDRNGHALIAAFALGIAAGAAAAGLVNPGVLYYGGFIAAIGCMGLAGHTRHELRPGCAGEDARESIDPASSQKKDPAAAQSDREAAAGHSYRNQKGAP